MRVSLILYSDFYAANCTLKCNKVPSPGQSKTPGGIPESPVFLLTSGNFSRLPHLDISSGSQQGGCPRASQILSLLQINPRGREILPEGLIVWLHATSTP